MTTVKKIIDQKSNTIFSVRSTDSIADVLKIMRDFRVRAVLVIDDGALMGIVSQGDCAIKVLLPGHDTKEVRVKEIMTSKPMTVKPTDPLEACMGLMASRNFRHLPVLDAGRVVGVISIGDVVKDRIREMGQQINFLETYIKGHGA